MPNRRGRRPPIALPIAFLVSGASGTVLPRHLLAVLAARPEVERIHLVVSAGASQVFRHELGSPQAGAADLVASAGLAAGAAEKIVVHRDSDLAASISSGSYRLGATVVMPCSASTAGALASGSARTLIHRAGAVALKERWPLVLGFRETPLSLLHLENLRRLVHAGAIVLPPIPAFYVGGEDMPRFLDHYALRVLDQMGIVEPGAPGLRWS